MGGQREGMGLVPADSPVCSDESHERGIQRIIYVHGGTHINFAPPFRSIGLVNESIDFIPIMEKLLGRVPHNEISEALISHKALRPLPWIAVRKCKFMANAIVPFNDGTLLELKQTASRSI